MSVLVFDTHDYFKRLIAASFSVEQAEMLIELQKISCNSILEQMKHIYSDQLG